VTLLPGLAAPRPFTFILSFTPHAAPSAQLVTRKLTRVLGSLLGLAVFLIALLVLRRELSGGRIDDVVQHAADISAEKLVIAVLFTIASFLVLTGYDNLSLRYIRHPLPYRRTALASFINYAFSQGLGFPLLTGGSVRFRLYSRWGLSAAQITQLVVFASATFWLGVLTLAGIVFAIAPPGISRVLPVAGWIVRPVGLVMLSVVAAYAWWTLTGHKLLRLWSWRLRRPAPRLAALQLAVACADWVMASAVLFVLMPAEAGLHFPAFLGIFLLAFVAGIISHVPAGLGVFETVIILLLPPSVPEAAVLGALLVYRGVYYLFPLLVAIVMLAAHEVLARPKIDAT
jgi:uncharacterized membrane protein YbhN (UPF0104 family)